MNTIKAMIVIILTPLLGVSFVLGLIYHAIWHGFQKGRDSLSDWLFDLYGSFGSSGDDDPLTVQPPYNPYNTLTHKLPLGIKQCELTHPISGDRCCLADGHSGRHIVTKIRTIDEDEFGKYFDKGDDDTNNGAD